MDASVGAEWLSLIFSLLSAVSRFNSRAVVGKNWSDLVDVGVGRGGEIVLVDTA